MPSVFVLDGPNLRDQPFHLMRSTNSRTSLMGGGLGTAVAVGLGEITDRMKTLMIAAGTVAVVGIVFYRGLTRKKLGKGFFGVRRRRRRR